MRALLGAAVVFALVLGIPAGAVIIASGDGTGNTSSPADDPGWDHVAALSWATAVYIGDAWMLTADHLLTVDVEIEGVLYRAVPGSDVTLAPADLKLFRIESDPGLPPLPIATDPPADEVVMIGNGRNRGEAIYDWDSDPQLDGWYWGPGRAVRWGSNEVLNPSLETPPGSGIVYFTTNFSESGGTTHECQAAGGDSGGAVFSKNEGVWELTGILLTRSLYPLQPTESALFGNEILSAQLAEYRSQILSEMALSYPCNDGKDDDGDGQIDYPDDPGCDDLLDPFETSAALPCDDGIDNDGDGGIDFDPVTYANPGDEATPPFGDGDPGCGSPSWGTETPRCQDGIDNDGDGMMDYDAGLFANGVADPAGPDPHCVGDPSRNSEAASSHSCGLGAELALLLPPLLWMRRRRRSANLLLHPR